MDKATYRKLQDGDCFRWLMEQVSVLPPPEDAESLTARLDAAWEKVAHLGPEMQRAVITLLGVYFVSRIEGELAFMARFIPKPAHESSACSS